MGWRGFDEDVFLVQDRKYMRSHLGCCLPYSTLFGEGISRDVRVAKFDTCKRLCRKQPVAMFEFWCTIWPALAVCIPFFT